MSYVKKVLKHEYGIYVKKVHIFGTPGYWGWTYYLPYEIRGCEAGSIVSLVGQGKAYPSPEAILEAARKGEL